jgi:hypothetical protein
VSELDGAQLMAMVELRDEVMRRWQADKRAADLDDLLAVDAALMPALEAHEQVTLLRSHIRELQDRMNGTGAAGDLELVVETAREVCRLARPPENLDLSQLCYFLRLRYQRWHDVADLEEAAAAGRRSVQGPSRDQDELALCLSHLFDAVTALAEDPATGSPEVFDEAVAVAERAVQLFHVTSRVPALHAANLVTALRSRSQGTGRQADLDRAISWGQRALDIGPPGDPEGLGRLQASLVAALTLRFRQSGDDAALDQALALLQHGRLDPSPDLLETLGGLIGALGERLGGRAADRYRRVRDALLTQYEQGLTLVTAQMMEDAAQARDLVPLDSAIGLINEGARLGGATRRPLYVGLGGEVLIRRWQITLARPDLDTAIDLLIEASSSETDEELAGQHAKLAGQALMWRFRRRRRADDLAAAERQLRRAAALTPAREKETHDELRALSRAIRDVTTTPPPVSRPGVAEADREDLSSPHALANQQAWNEGRPRTSGLTWLRTREREEGATVPPDRADDTDSRRVLFLRTFPGDDSSYVILNSLALALGQSDVVEIVGDAAERPLVDQHWRLAFGADARPGHRVSLITPTDQGGRREVLERISRADAIVLFISPRDADFPEFPFPPRGTKTDRGSVWDDDGAEPLARPLTSQGLLREICYLSRLQRLPHTVVVCAAQYQAALDDLIALAGLAAAGDPVTPALTAADKQAGQLRKAFRGLTCDRAGRREIMPGLARALRGALEAMLADEQSRPSPPWTPEQLSGTSPHPRRLPPDNEPKIIGSTDVADLYFIPSGQITEISLAELLSVLGYAAVRTGCPHCRGPIEKLFFYTYTAQRRGEPRAICQVCGGAASLRGDALTPR